MVEGDKANGDQLKRVEVVVERVDEAERRRAVEVESELEQKEAGDRVGSFCCLCCEPFCKRSR